MSTAKHNTDLVMIIIVNWVSIEEPREFRNWSTRHQSVQTDSVPLVNLSVLGGLLKDRARQGLKNASLILWSLIFLASVNS